jgi:hypothetical protein
MTGADLIFQERNRQIKEEGWTTEHDKEHSQEQLVQAAICYALPERFRFLKELFWAWDEKWWKPKDRIKDLVRAGALIAAEIDRLQREAE